MSEYERTRVKQRTESQPDDVMVVEIFDEETGEKQGETQLVLLADPIFTDA